ncbi:MAG TPA: type II toxin-antitoxin system Phd/YefM family antitoxin [Candidatus Binatia bacterium]|jgi:PHD/YefM family antitoxin component YafN of YafNO toxin-antitoxin module|nr:type II toxin-antitoxin system Phd/YefM family antitoxin [Candidatus Binatia bacterium]
MPNILPISDLRNYTAVLNKVDVDKPVYLTRNGRGSYVISKIDDYDREVTAEKLLELIREGEKSITDDGGITLDEFAKQFKITL